MTQLLVINTGGTISMQQDVSGSLAASSGDELPALFDQLADGLALRIHWVAISQLIERSPQYDGYLVLHGTDTMAYTASALAFSCAHINKPIVLTGAQVPLSNPGSDGMQNIRISLEAFNNIAALPSIPMIAFGGLLLRGCRARKSSTHSAIGFDSPNAPLIAELFPKARWFNNTPSATNMPANCARDLRFSNQVMQLSLHPGLDANMLRSMILSSSIEGLIVRVFGTGTAPDALDLGNLLSECRERTNGRFECAVIVTDVYNGSLELSRYAAGKTLQAKDIIDGKDMTPEAATTKLMWALAQPRRNELRQLMSSNLVGELTP